MGIWKFFMQKLHQFTTSRDGLRAPRELGDSRNPGPTPGATFLPRRRALCGSLPLKICEGTFCLGREGLLKPGDQGLTKNSARLRPLPGLELRHSQVEQIISANRFFRALSCSKWPSRGTATLLRQLRHPGRCAGEFVRFRSDPVNAR